MAPEEVQKYRAPRGERRAGEPGGLPPALQRTIATTGRAAAVHLRPARVEPASLSDALDKLSLAAPSDRIGDGEKKQAPQSSPPAAVAAAAVTVADAAVSSEMPAPPLVSL